MQVNGDFRRLFPRSSHCSPWIQCQEMESRSQLCVVFLTVWLDQEVAMSTEQEESRSGPVLPSCRVR